jgi:hypothetical protein
VTSARRSGRLPLIIRSVCAAATLAMIAGACSSSSGSAPVTSPSISPAQALAMRREASAFALLAQCAIIRDIGGVAGTAARASARLPAAQQWLHRGQLTLTSASGSQFNAWYQGHLAGVVSHGTSIDRWGEQAVSSGRLPGQICGAGLTARGLYRQIYAKDPAMLKDDPWRR